MLTQTSEIGVSVLVYLGLRAQTDPISPRQIAAFLGTSPSYTAKVCGQLVRAEILRSVRGSGGGVVLDREPATLSLREIVEACQGEILPDYCHTVPASARACAFHTAMAELHGAIIGVLGHWTLADLVATPAPQRIPGLQSTCVITRNWPAFEEFLRRTAR